MNTLLSSLCSHLHLKPEHTALLDERDTSDVWRQFAIWLLVGPDDGVIRFTNPGTLQYNDINRIAQLYIEDCKDRKRWKAAYDDAWSAAADVFYAAADAEDAAWSAAKAAWSVAKAASSAAFYAAEAAKAVSNAAAAAAAAYYDPTTAAAWSDTNDAYYDPTNDAAWNDSEAAAAAAYAHYQLMADKLIELLQAAPIMMK